MVALFGNRAAGNMSEETFQRDPGDFFFVVRGLRETLIFDGWWLYSVTALRER